MPTEHWQNIERFLLSRKVQVWLLLALVVGFTVVRWQQRLEPWNSDDMSLFGYSLDAVSGHHWLLDSAAVSSQPPTHALFRIGLLPATVLAIKVLGANATAYYSVPLAFSLLGFVILYWVNLSSFGPLVALAFALIHVVSPFELEHSSLLLTDLPAAAMSLLSLCLLDASARRTQRGRIVCAVLAGVAAWETYLLRNNGLVLLAPAFLVFFLYRTTRWQTVWAAAVALFGVLAEQAFLVYRGFSWGIDWTSARVDIARYDRTVPVTTWHTFLMRQFSYQISSFPGRTGILAAVLVASSLVLHLLMLRFERRRLLLAIAAFGLFTWLVFSFSISEVVPKGVRAVSPINFRFIQPFTYSSLVAWAWAWAALRKALPRPFAMASAALPLLLLTFSYVASIFHIPHIYRKSETHRLVVAIQAELDRAGEPLQILGLRDGVSLRVPQVFCCAGSPYPVEWHELSAGEIADQVKQGSPAMVLRDTRKEFAMARYLAPRARRVYRAQLARLKLQLRRTDEFVYGSRKYELYAPKIPGHPRPKVRLPAPRRHRRARRRRR